MGFAKTQRKIYNWGIDKVQQYTIQLGLRLQVQQLQEVHILEVIHRIDLLKDKTEVNQLHTCNQQTHGLPSTIRELRNKKLSISQNKIKRIK